LQMREILLGIKKKKKKEEKKAGCFFKQGRIRAKQPCKSIIHYKPEHIGISVCSRSGWGRSLLMPASLQALRDIWSSR